MIFLDKLLFFDKAISEFYNQIFANVYMDYQLTSDEQVIKEMTPNGYVVYEGFTLKDRRDNKTYFIPSNYKDTDGIEHRVKFPIKITKSKKVIWKNKIFYVADYVTTKFPESDKLPFHEFVDNWFNIIHHNEDDKFIAKIAVLTTMLTNSFCAISTPPSFGKDGIVSNIYNLTMFGRNMSGGSEAKVSQMLEDKHTTFNEVVGVNQSIRDVLYPFFKNVAAGQKFYEHKTIGSGATKNRYEIGDYGFVVFFNEPEQALKDGNITWEEQYDYAVFDRIFPLGLTGTVSKDNQYSDVFGINWVEYVKKHKQEYIDFVSRFYYDLSTINTQKLSYPLTRYNIDYRDRKKGEDSIRWQNTFNNIGRIVSRYVESKYSEDDREQEFYKIMDMIYDRNRSYISKVKELGLLTWC